MISEISAFELHQLLLEEANVVILDPREEGLFSLSPHIFQSINLPLSRIEWRLNYVLPKKNINIVVASDDEHLNDRTIKRLQEIGYLQLKKLKGGLDEWANQGYLLYTGFNTPSKAFGEFIEHEFNTPSISPEELNEWMRQGKDILLVDSRTPEEHNRGTIPSSLSIPGAELALRLPEMISNPDTTIIVNCAGRTRSIIGAQSLRNIKIKNKVMALRNGTMGWKLAGFEVEKNSQKFTPDLNPTSGNLNLNKEILEKYHIKTADWECYQNWISSDDPTMTYLFDVRMRNEYNERHPKGAIYSPGGQLIQATDTFIASKSARILLYDDHLIRSAITGSWLKQMGYKEVFQLDPTDRKIEFTVGVELISIHEVKVDEIPKISVETLFSSRNSYTVIDLSYGKNYVERHIDGAYWCVRSRLCDILERVDSTKPIVLTSDEPLLANFAGQEIKNKFPNQIFLLDGGNSAWFSAGYPSGKGDNNILTEINDSFVKPFEAKNQVESMKQYLSWEIGLTEKVKNDETIKFYKF